MRLAINANVNHNFMLCLELERLDDGHEEKFDLLEEEGALVLLVVAETIFRGP